YFANQIRHVQRRADVEEGLVVPAKELKRVVSRPSRDIEISRHSGDHTATTEMGSSQTVREGNRGFVLRLSRLRSRANALFDFWLRRGIEAHAFRDLGPGFGLFPHQQQYPTQITVRNRHGWIKLKGLLESNHSAGKLVLAV